MLLNVLLLRRFQLKEECVALIVRRRKYFFFFIVTLLHEYFKVCSMLLKAFHWIVRLGNRNERVSIFSYICLLFTYLYIYILIFLSKFSWFLNARNIYLKWVEYWL